MSYKIKNGFLLVLFNNMWYSDEVLYSMYPDLKKEKLTLWTSNG